MDSSPRGGVPGFVKVLTDSQLAIPDSSGNNRLDSLNNVVETGRIGLLFLIPGMDETLRLNGSAFISNNTNMLSRFSSELKQPKTCIVVEIEEVFFHCAKAFMRSKLWSPDSKIERSEMPSMGQMLHDQIGGNSKIETQDEMVKRYQKDL